MAAEYGGACRNGAGAFLIGGEPVVPTEDLRTELRELCDEQIPEGGSAANTRFSVAQVDRFLTRAQNVYLAAAEAWMLKAAMMQRELGHLQETAAGDERTRRVDLQTALNYCLSMAEAMRRSGQAQDGASGGSRVFELEPPDVLGTSTPTGTQRILGDER